MPVVISLAVILWLFFTVSSVTDTLLILIPKRVTHDSGPTGPGTGPLLWYWRLVALLLAVIMTWVVGVIARNYLGRKFIEGAEELLLRVPFLSKIYATTKQVNDAFASGGKSSFKTVVMVEFPRAGSYSLGFLTGAVHDEIRGELKCDVACVFIPTTPNPTAGFLILVPEQEVLRLNMSVADALKFIVSLGSIIPEGSLFEPARKL